MLIYSQVNLWNSSIHVYLRLAGLPSKTVSKQKQRHSCTHIQQTLIFFIDFFLFCFLKYKLPVRTILFTLHFLRMSIHSLKWTLHCLLTTRIISCVDSTMNLLALEPRFSCRFFLISNKNSTILISHKHWNICVSANYIQIPWNKDSQNLT